eukprot:jgi/Ulvmu1/3435/UM016_0054.1
MRTTRPRCRLPSSAACLPCTPPSPPSSSQLHPPAAVALDAYLLPPSLPSLTCLRINVEAHPGACAPLARCLKHLPCLGRLQVRLYVDAHNKTPPTLRTLQRAAACLAALARLTELSVSVRSSSTDPNATMIWSEVAETDTNLLELLPLLNTPALDRLSLTSEAGKIQEAQLWSAIGRLRAVVCSHLSIEADTPPLRGMCGPPDHQVPLPQLRSLDVFSNTAGACLPTAAEVVLRAPPAMSRLCLSPSINCPSHSRPGLVRACNREDGMDALSLVLKRFTSLRILKLDVLCAEMGWSGSGSLAHALQELTALTELALQSEHEPPRSEGTRSPVLVAQPLSDAVPQLQHLQELRLCGRTASPLLDAPLDFLRACSGLRALTELCLICRDVSFEQTCHAVLHLPSLRSLIVLERVFENCDQDQMG